MSEKFHPIMVNPETYWSPEVLNALDQPPTILFDGVVSIEDRVKINKYLIDKYNMPYKVCRYCAELVPIEINSKLCKSIKGFCNFIFN